MSPKFPKLFVFVLVAALLLSACNNPMAATPGVWYNPFSWGDKTAAQTAEEILANAQAEKTVRDAQAAATAMAGGVVPTTVNVVSTPEVVNTPAAQSAPATDRLSRLVELDAIYRSSGWQAWLKAAGVQCDANVEARQPEEETIVYNGETRVVVSGIQLRGNCKVAWPALVTTDRPAEVTTSADSRTYQPDLKNPSVLYTNVDLHGQGTVWVDGSNWGQLDPTK